MSDPIRTDSLRDLLPSALLFKAACLAAMGGLVRELVADGQHSLVKFIAGAFIGVFCGLLVYFTCKHWGVGENLTAVLTGTGGYIGTPIIDLIGKGLKRFIKNGKTP